MTRVTWLFVCLMVPVSASAQTGSAEPFRITDNSFLVEEAFNQEKGIFQNIFGAAHVNGAWAAAFTQEWPVTSQAHQFSYTVAWLESDRTSGAGDVLLNYRYQAMTEGARRPAFSPRASVILPTGDSRRGFGGGSVGLQVNLPFSKQTGDWYWHWNAGMTWLPKADVLVPEGAPARHENLASPFLAGSAIYRLRPMFNLMLESFLSSDEIVDDAGTARSRGFTLSPGVRGGWDIGDKQIVLGFAVPTTWRSGDSATGVFAYFSYELPFMK